MAKGSANQFPHVTFVKQASKPATPAAGNRALYFKTDNKLYGEDEAGTETEVGAGSIGGSTGNTDNVVLLASGTGGATVQASPGGVTINDAGSINIPSGQTYNINNVPHTHAGGGGGNVISTGAYGAEPGSPSTGDLYFPNNSFMLEQYTGSAWTGFGPIFPITPPPALTNWAWINQSTASAAEASGAITMTVPNTGGDNLRILKMAAPATPYKITAMFVPTQVVISTSFGMCFRQSSDGKLHLLLLAGAGSNLPGMGSFHFNDPTSYNATTTTPIPFTLNGPNLAITRFFRIEDDGVNRILSYSADNVNYVVVKSTTRTDFLTADEVGFYVNAAGSAGSVTLLSWRVT